MTNKKRILVADDEEINRDILVDILSPEHEVVTAENGEQTLNILKNVRIDLILLDVVMPDIDGYELCRYIKSNERMHEIPIIFVTTLDNPDDESKGLELGAADYITKPVCSAIVLARVTNQLALRDAIEHLRLLNLVALDANPNTGLPGNSSIYRYLQQSAEECRPEMVIYADLDNFKAYNDAYGFAKGDEVIQYTVKTISDLLEEKAVNDYFLGHIGGDDFVIVIPTTLYSQIIPEFIHRFDANIKSFYSSQDATRGSIRSMDRSGIEMEFPLISISMGAVDLSKRCYSSYHEIVDLCTTAKKESKKITGSNIFIERREKRI